MSLAAAAYRTVPPCVDQRGHHFSLSPETSTPVCERCGLKATS